MGIISNVFSRKVLIGRPSHFVSAMERPFGKGITPARGLIQLWLLTTY